MLPMLFEAILFSARRRVTVVTGQLAARLTLGRRGCLAFEQFEATDVTRTSDDYINSSHAQPYAKLEKISLRF